jgi:hypothetical protein
MITTTKYSLKMPEAGDSADLRIYVGDNMQILDTHKHVWTDITNPPATYPPSTHTHAYNTLTGIPTTFTPATHTHAYSTLTGIPTTFPPSTHTHAYSTLTGIPTEFTPASHDHLWADITDPPATYPPSSHTHTWTQITSKPTTFTPATHSHPVFTPLADGFVPKTTTSNTTDFLRRDGTWATPPSIAPAWGGIIGTLSNQTDLNTRLTQMDTKIEASPYLSNGFVKRIGDDIDLNTITTSGIYSVSTSTNAPPLSIDNPDNWFYLEVIRHDPVEETNTEWILQKAYDFRNGTFVRRRWYDAISLTNKWDNWVRIDDDRDYVLNLNGGSSSALGANAWQRVNLSGQFEKSYINWDDTNNLFDVPQDGFYLITGSTYINMQYEKGFYLELWKIGGTQTNPSVISCFAPSNGWNYYHGSRIFWLNKAQQYEFVWKHTDVGYSRTLNDIRVLVTKI